MVMQICGQQKTPPHGSYMLCNRAPCKSFRRAALCDLLLTIVAMPCSRTEMEASRWRRRGARIIGNASSSSAFSCAERTKTSELAVQNLRSLCTEPLSIDLWVLEACDKAATCCCRVVGHGLLSSPPLVSRVGIPIPSIHDNQCSPRLDWVGEPSLADEDLDAVMLGQALGAKPSELENGDARISVCVK